MASGHDSGKKNAPWIFIRQSRPNILDEWIPDPRQEARSTEENTLRENSACASPTDEGPEIGADRLAALPVRNAEIADGLLGEAVKALSEGLVVDLLPHVEKPPWRLFPGK